MKLITPQVGQHWKWKSLKDDWFWKILEITDKELKVDYQGQIQYHSIGEFFKCVSMGWKYIK